MATLLYIFATVLAISIAAAEKAPVRDACGAESGPAQCAVLQDSYDGNHAYIQLVQRRAGAIPKANETAALAAHADAEFLSVGGLEYDEEEMLGSGPPEVSSKAQRSDVENNMPIEEAQRLDEAALLEYPDALPQVPIMFPDRQEAHDAAIVSKLQGLSRSSQIRLPDGRNVPYWQTIQYAHRHFRSFITRFRVPQGGKKTFHTLNDTEKIKIWGLNGLMRKLLCTDAFQSWAMTSTFQEPNTPDSVYDTFEHADKGIYISMTDLQGAKAAVANVIGLVFDYKFFSSASDGYIIGIFTHEQSHNLGYSHKSQVPYPVQRFMVGAYPEKAAYEAVDLANYPDFEVMA